MKIDAETTPEGMNAPDRDWEQEILEALHPPLVRYHLAPDNERLYQPRVARQGICVVSGDATRHLATEAETQSILTSACEEIGLNANGARLLRLGSNAVYRLTSPVVARVAYANTDSEAADRTVQVARWLESAGYPAVRAIPGNQPVTIDGRPVTFWESISDGEQYATIDQVADVIARLHKLVPPDDLRLPELDPLANADRRIAESQ